MCPSAWLLVLSLLAHCVGLVLFVRHLDRGAP